jgi:glycosyltransferase involved in cell wall biosynthesis
MIKLAIVSPCYNEEAVLDISAKRLNQLFDRLIEQQMISPDSFVMFVNDGSKDQTWPIISRLHSESPRFKGLNLAHNVGHQNAIMAGMMTAKDMADAVVTMDADLQDDLEAIPQMIEAYNQGYDVVYGVKVQREADPILKRLSAQAFYKLQKSMGIDSIYNHADFRFISKRVLNQLALYREKNLYLRGIIPQIGYPSTTVDDVIAPRPAGESKYNLRRMLSLALNGITSFSVKPLYAILYLGIIFILISIIIGFYVIYSLIAHTAVHGWASLMLSVWLVGGFILIAVGGVGLYVGKIYQEVKDRPLYHVQDLLD